MSLSKFLKEHILGIALFAIITGIISSVIYDTIKSRSISGAPPDAPKPSKDDRFYFATITYNPNKPVPDALDHIDCMHDSNFGGGFSVTALKPGEPKALFARNKPIVVRFAHHRARGSFDYVESDYYSLEAVAFDGRYPTKTEQRDATPHSLLVGTDSRWSLTHDGHDVQPARDVAGFPQMSLHEPE